MSAAAPQETTQRSNLAGRFRSASVGALFAFARIVPGLLHLRRNPRSWQLFRVALGLAGAALVILPLSLPHSWTTGIAGLAMFTAAILLPPAKTETSADRKARELGALVVVNGGKYQPGNAPAAAVHIFVGAQHLWALDSHFQTLLVIPAAEISSVRAEESGGRWSLQILWSGHTAEFSYRGIFAERRARIAETAVHKVVRASPPVLSKRRAASA